MNQSISMNQSTEQQVEIYDVDSKGTFRFVMHINGAFSLFTSILSIYMIIFKSTPQMKVYRWYLINLTVKTCCQLKPKLIILALVNCFWYLSRRFVSASASFPSLRSMYRRAIARNQIFQTTSVSCRLYIVAIRRFSCIDLRSFALPSGRNNSKHIHASRKEIDNSNDTHAFVLHVTFDHCWHVFACCRSWCSLSGFENCELWNSFELLCILAFSGSLPLQFGSWLRFFQPDCYARRGILRFEFFLI